jgi:hypothetical protein
MDSDLVDKLHFGLKHSSTHSLLANMCQQSSIEFESKRKQKSEARLQAWQIST